MSLRAFKRRWKRRLGLYPKRPDYRSYVGRAEDFELIGRLQFKHLKFWGAAPQSYLLDIGCGSVRGGKFAIALLEPVHYYGIELTPGCARIRCNSV
jgi:hypothetical protein